MNKLQGNKMIQHKWGNAVVWAHTDSYIAKTIEIPQGKKNSLVVHQQKEKSIIVIRGEVLLTYGGCCTETDVPIYKLPVGWSWYIQPGMIHRYEAFNGPAVIIEISSPEMEDGIILVDEEGLVFTPPKDVVQELQDIQNKIKEEKLTDGESGSKETGKEETPKRKTKKGRPPKASRP